MKTLFLIRHAKSSWDDPRLDDMDRPLSERGLRDAPEMGRRLAERQVKPDRLISSPALRALSTARIIAQALNYDTEQIVVDKRLYEATPKRLLKVIREQGAGPRCIMLFGHNPELTEFAQSYVPTLQHMPTCAVVQLDFNIESWEDLGEEQPVSVWFSKPRQD
ncbi:MAG: SixA phosphatase family protein [Thermoflexales bacterium]